MQDLQSLLFYHNFLFFWFGLANRKNPPSPLRVPRLVVVMKDTPRSRKTVTSSLNEKSADQLGNRVVVGKGGGRYSRLLDSDLKTA
jgi:hypothetical protein